MDDAAKIATRPTDGLEAETRNGELIYIGDIIETLAAVPSPKIKSTPDAWDTYNAGLDLGYERLLHVIFPPQTAKAIMDRARAMRDAPKSA